MLASQRGGGPDVVSQREHQYVQLVRRLQALGHHQHCAPESVPLVESLLSHLTHATEALRQVKAHEIQLQHRVDSYAKQDDPLRRENMRLTRENNQLHLDMIRFTEDRQVEDRKFLQSRAKLEKELSDAHFIISQQKQDNNRLRIQIDEFKSKLSTVMDKNAIGSPVTDLPQGRKQEQVIRGVTHGKAQQERETPHQDTTNIDILRAVEKQKSELEAEMHRVQELHDQLQGQVDVYKKSIHERDLEILRLGRLVEQQRGDTEFLASEAANSQMKATITDLKAKIEFLHTQLADLNQENSKLRESMKENSEFATVIEELKSQVEQDASEVHLLAEELRTKTEALQRREEEFASLQLELDTIRKKSAQIPEVKESSKLLSPPTNTNVVSSDGKAFRLELQVMSLLKEKDSLLRQVKDMELELDETYALLEKAKDEIEGLQIERQPEPKTEAFDLRPLFDLVLEGVSTIYEKYSQLFSYSHHNPQESVMEHAIQDLHGDGTYESKKSVVAGIFDHLSSALTPLEDLIESMDAELKQKDQEISDLRILMEEKEKETKDIMQRTKLETEQASFLARNSQKAESDSARLRNHLQQQQKDLDALRRLMSEKEKECSILKAHADRMSSLYDDSNAMTSEVNEERKKLEDALALMNARQQELNKQLNEASAQNERLKTLAHELEEQLTAEESRRLYSTTEIAELERKVHYMLQESLAKDKQIEEMKDIIRVMVSQEDAMDSHVRNVEEENRRVVAAEKQSREKCRVSENRLQELERELLKLQGFIREFDQEKDYNTSELDSKAEEIRALKASIKELTTKLSKTETELQSAWEQVNNTRRQYQDRERLCASLKEQVDASQIELSKLRNERELSQMDYDKITADLKELVRENQAIHQQLAEALIQQDHLQEQNQILLGHSHHTEEVITEKEREREDLVRSQQDLLVEQRKASQIISTMSAENEQCRRQISQQLQEIQSIRLAMQESHQKCDRLQLELDSASHHIDHMTRTISSLEMEVEHLRQENQSFQKDMQQIQGIQETSLSARQQLGMQIEQLQQSRAQLQKLLDESYSEREHLMTQVEVERRNVQELEALIIEKRSEQASMELSVQEKIAELQHKQQQLKKIHDAYQELKLKYEQLVNEREDLIAKLGAGKREDVEWKHDKQTILMEYQSTQVKLREYMDICHQQSLMIHQLEEEHKKFQLFTLKYEDEIAQRDMKISQLTSPESKKSETAIASAAMPLVESNQATSQIERELRLQIQGLQQENRKFENQLAKEMDHGLRLKEQIRKLTSELDSYKRQ